MISYQTDTRLGLLKVLGENNKNPQRWFNSPLYKLKDALEQIQESSNLQQRSAMEIFAHWAPNSFPPETSGLPVREDLSTPLNICFDPPAMYILNYIDIYIILYLRWAVSRLDCVITRVVQKTLSERQVALALSLLGSWKTKCQSHEKCRHYILSTGSSTSHTSHP